VTLSSSRNLGRLADHQPLPDLLPPMARRLTVQHTTMYRYHQPVRFGEHRLMFRPIDSHDLRLTESSLSIEPRPNLRWLHDVFSNSIAIAEFGEDQYADTLTFRSEITVEHYGLVNPDFPIEAYARELPFTYSSDELPDLQRTIERHYPDPEHKVDAWARGFLDAAGSRTQTEDFLRRMVVGIKESFAYQQRFTPGVQTPVETLACGSGTCRDLALLMMEAVRSVGLAARFVSGYLYDPALDGAEGHMVGAGNTHAWVRVYLPGSGWVEFDPTNGMVGGTNLIRVAVTRDPHQAIPLEGTFYGPPEAFASMDVEVKVTAG
jgi:transglutaminase-like putative cysteine protease